MSLLLKIPIFSSQNLEISLMSLSLGPMSLSLRPMSPCQIEEIVMSPSGVDPEGGVLEVRTRPFRGPPNFIMRGKKR